MSGAIGFYRDPGLTQRLTSLDVVRVGAGGVVIGVFYVGSPALGYRYRSAAGDFITLGVVALQPGLAISLTPDFVNAAGSLAIAATINSGEAHAVAVHYRLDLAQIPSHSFYFEISEMIEEFGNG